MFKGTQTRGPLRVAMLLSYDAALVRLHGGIIAPISGYSPMSEAGGSAGDMRSSRVTHTHLLLIL